MNESLHYQFVGMLSGSTMKCFQLYWQVNVNRVPVQRIIYLLAPREGEAPRKRS